MEDDATESHYRDDVRTIAREVWEERDNPTDDGADRIHEFVDGSAWVIYTARAIRVCLYSRNDDACFDEMGTDCLSGCDSACAVYTRIAYSAMVADVRECLADNRDEWEEEADAKAEDDDE